MFFYFQHVRQSTIIDSLSKREGAREKLIVVEQKPGFEQRARVWQEESSFDGDVQADSWFKQAP